MKRLCLLLLALLLATGASQACAADFRACVSELKREATAKGVTAQTFDAALAGVEPDTTVIEAMDNQPEFKTPIWDYLGFLVDDQRIIDGQAMMRKYDRVLRAAEQQFGVNRFVIAAVWGVESDYGRDAGDSFLPHALAKASRCFPVGTCRRWLSGVSYPVILRSSSRTNPHAAWMWAALSLSIRH